MPLTRVRDRQTRVRHRKLAKILKNFAPVTAIQRLISAPGPTSFGTASMHAFHESSHQCHAVMHIPGDLTGPGGCTRGHRTAEAWPFCAGLSTR